MLAMLLTTAIGCDSDEHAGHDHAAESAPAPAANASPNRIELSPEARRNLGIEFVTVQRRSVQDTLRVPGVFELRPEARRHFLAMLPGRVELLVEQYDRVEPGQPLFRLNAPEWQSMRHNVTEAAGEIKLADAALAVSQARLEELQGRIAFLEKRLETYRDLAAQPAGLRQELADLKNQLPRLKAELQAKRVERAEAVEHYQSYLNGLSSVSGLSVAELMEVVPAQGHDHSHAADEGVARDHGPLRRWQKLHPLVVRAESAGIVDRLPVTPGQWVEQGAQVLTTVDPKALRFVAHLPQADLPAVDDQAGAAVTPPDEVGGQAKEVPGTLTIGFDANPQTRTVPIYLTPTRDLPRWTKAGVSAYLEIVTAGDGRETPAIPTRAVISDGMDKVYFLRDPNDPNVVIRKSADLGVSDGRWVQVLSELIQGDEVVVQGAYALKLASGGGQAKAPEGYHYHADGTLHSDDAH